MFTRASLHLLETLGRNSSARCVRPRKTHNKVISQLKNNFFFCEMTVRIKLFGAQIEIQTTQE